MCFYRAEIIEGTVYMRNVVAKFSMVEGISLEFYSGIGFLGKIQRTKLEENCFGHSNAKQF